MGEYSDMMLDGTCCCSCGEFLGNGDGYPVYCAACQPEESPKVKLRSKQKVKLKKTVPCSHAGCLKKFVDDNAMRQHLHHFHKERNVFIKT